MGESTESNVPEKKVTAEATKPVAASATPAPQPAAAPAASTAPAVEGRMRNLLIFGTIGVFAAIIFGLLYLFVIAPSAPADGAGWSVGWFLFSFATGLTMIVMPCTLPLAFVIVPLSMGKGLVKGLSMAIAFGVGVAATLSLYGIAAAVLGSLALDTLGTDLEVVKNWVYFVAGIFALVFALSEIGLLNIHMPTYSGAAPAFIQKRQEVFKAFLLGLFLGNIGVGCPHPATPLLLIEIASSGDILYGWLMFLVHAIGRVLPLLLLAFLAILGVNGLNWLMSRKDMVERTTGWAMVFVAGFILTLGLFTHDWWVNSGIHSGLEAITQEAFFNTLLNENFDTNVAHVHGLEEGEGLFGLPLEWGHWFLVLVWLVPIWWWWLKRRKELLNHPSFKLKALESKIDALEKDRRQIESMVNLDELEKNFDLSARHQQLDQLEAERRKYEEQAQYGEEGELKSPIAQSYAIRFLKLHRNYLFVVSIGLILLFVHFIPQSFYLKSIAGIGHGDHGAHDAGGGHDHGAGASGGHAHSGGQSLDGIHAMPDGSIMNGAGEIIAGAHVMPDGSIMLADGTTVGDDGVSVMKLNGTPFTKDIAGLPEASGPEFVELEDGEEYEIVASYVKKEIGNRTLRMLAYNGSVPGPFITAPQGAEIIINFRNDTDIDQTIHSHGVRIDNRSDGVPFTTQDPVVPGGTYRYKVKFDDAGVYWYHPHTREDYGQDLGLYGNYLVEPSDPEYWSAVNREVPIIIDDILIENEQISDFYKEFSNFALLGRFGNEFLVNGVQDFTTTVETGEVIRFFVTNVSNARTYNLAIPGAQVKLVGADLGKYERETYEEEVLISPAERVVIEVFFPEAGTYKLLSKTPTEDIELARFLAQGEVDVSYQEEFSLLRTNSDVVNEFRDFRSYRAAQPDKQVLLTIDLSNLVIDHSAHTGHAHGDAAGGIDHSQHAHAQVGADRMDTIQWNDDTLSDRANVTPDITWLMRDLETGKENMDINWLFKLGDLVKVRLINDANADHVMQHPIHFHGQRFVVLEENGEVNSNMVWKDTALVFPGETMDILVDMNNSGEWMSHCHIAEHLHAGMMLGFRVEDENGYARGDEYRRTVPTRLDYQDASIPDLPPTSADQIPLTQFEFTSPIDPKGHTMSVETNRYQAEKRQEVTIAVFDPAANSLLVNGAHPRPLAVTFVKSDNTRQIFTFPGNPAFNNIPKPTIPADDGHDHIHMLDPNRVFGFIPVAHAHGGVDDGHINATGQIYTYTVPVVFPDKGFYRGFVEFVPENSNEVVTLSFDVEVAPGGFSIDNFGWSLQMKWWILLITSLVLMSILSWVVYRYVVIKE